MDGGDWLVIGGVTGIVAALTGVAALAWQVIAHRGSGRRVTVRSSYFIPVYGPSNAPEFRDDDAVAITVTNRGRDADGRVRPSRDRRSRRDRRGPRKGTLSSSWSRLRSATGTSTVTGSPPGWTTAGIGVAQDGRWTTNRLPCSRSGQGLLLIRTP